MYKFYWHAKLIRGDLNIPEDLKQCQTSLSQRLTNLSQRLTSLSVPVQPQSARVRLRAGCRLPVGAIWATGSVGPPSLKTTVTEFVAIDRMFSAARENRWATMGHPTCGVGYCSICLFKSHEAEYKFGLRCWVEMF